MKKILIAVLLGIAMVVFFMQILKANAWILICFYWAVLAIKNALDLKGRDSDKKSTDNKEDSNGSIL